MAQLPQLPQGWSIDRTLRISLWYDGLASRWMDSVIACNPSAANTDPLRVEFEGRTVGMFGEGKTDGLRFRVLIDGEFMKTEKGADEWGSAPPMQGNHFYWRLFAADLPPGKHLLEIRPIPVDGGKGQLRIGFLGYAR